MQLSNTECFVEVEAEGVKQYSPRQIERAQKHRYKPLLKDFNLDEHDAYLASTIELSTRGSEHIERVMRSMDSNKDSFSESLRASEVW